MKSGQEANCDKTLLESDTGLLGELLIRLSHLSREACMLQNLAPDASRKRNDKSRSPMPVSPKILLGAFEAIIEMFIYDHTVYQSRTVLQQPAHVCQDLAATSHPESQVRNKDFDICNSGRLWPFKTLVAAWKTLESKLCGSRSV